VIVDSTLVVNLIGVLNYPMDSKELIAEVQGNDYC
jgi:hypothetical protein